MGVLSVTALFGYGALSLWWEYTAGGKLVLWVPSTTFFLLMVAGPAVFLEVSPQPLLGSARWAGHGKYGQVLVAPSPCQHWLCILPCYVGLLILTGLCLDVWGYEGKFKICGSAPLPVMACCVLSSVATSTRVCHDGAGKKETLFLGAPLLLPFLTIQAIVWGIQFNSATHPFVRWTHWSNDGCRIWSATTAPVLSQSDLLYSFQFAHLHMFQWVDFSGVFVYWVEDLLLSYSCPTCCKFRWRKKGVVLLHRDALVTLVLNNQIIFNSCMVPHWM